MSNTETICAISTAPGQGAIAIIRLSGEKSIEIADRIFRAKKKSKKLISQKSFTLLFGQIIENNNPIDDVLVSVFRSPHSFTGENSVEISCHGSIIIQQKILQLLVRSGAKIAKPGEFTQRAFLNGKMDLSQAEAVADLIAATSEASHKVALHQMRGGFSGDLQNLRKQLLTFISMVELELDFSEEDVEFADRKQLSVLIEIIDKDIKKLNESFRLGNVIKNGIPVAIVGEPNVGKSTLLNTLLNEEKALVSHIAGTTRDAIEDLISISGVLFRIIDTAGIRQSTDFVENLGIERTMQKIDSAQIVILLTVPDANAMEFRIMANEILKKNKKLIVVFNKMDIKKNLVPDIFASDFKTVNISAKTGENIEELIQEILILSEIENINENATIITNLRHFEALSLAQKATERVKLGLQNHISGDFLAQDIREIMHYFGEITGEITTDEILGNIFKNFCIGK